MIPLDFWRSMLAFHLMGIIEFEQGEEAADISAEIAALLELDQKLRAAPAGIPALLGLPASAPAAAIEQAREELLDRFAPERFGSAAAPEIKNIARDVCRRLLAPGSAAKPAPPPPAARELPGEMEWHLPAEVAAAPAAPEEPEAEFELSAEFAIDAEPIVVPEIIFDAEEQGESAAAAPSRPPASPSRENRRRSAGVRAAPLHMVDADHEKAWDLLLQAKELYEKHEYLQAVPLLKKAIKLEARQGDFYYLLGLCQSEFELSRNEAEINLKKAIELKSWSADPVYALGVLYRGQGKAKLAERCFQRVKEIAYEHTGASRALVDLRRQKAGGRFFPRPEKSVLVEASRRRVFGVTFLEKTVSILP